MDPQTLDLLIEEEERKAWLSSTKEEGKWKKKVNIKLSIRRGRYKDALQHSRFRKFNGQRKFE